MRLHAAYLRHASRLKEHARWSTSPTWEPIVRTVSALDPCRYVRQADLALLDGSRDEAAALIAQAYLAFDLVLADCDDVTGLGRVWSGRSS